MDILNLLLSIVIGFYSFVLVLRTWLQFCNVDTRMPLSQTLLRLTQPLVEPVGKVFPTARNVCLPALAIAFALLTFEKLFWGVPISVALLAGLLGVVKIFGETLFYAILIRALMSWVTQGNHPLDYMVAQITEPVLGKVRALLPRTGMLDFSVMVLGFALIFANQLLYRFLGALWAMA